MSHVLTAVAVLTRLSPPTMSSFSPKHLINVANTSSYKHISVIIDIVTLLSFRNGTQMRHVSIQVPLFQ